MNNENIGGISYTGMDEILSQSGPIAKLRREVNEFFDYKIGEYKQVVGANYKGDAADIYVANLLIEKDKMQKLLDDIFLEYQKCIEETSSEYKEEERTLAESSNINNVSQ